MWFLLPTRLGKQLRIWLQILLFVLLLHVIGLWLLMGYRGMLYQHNMTIGALPFDRTIPMVLLPMVKNVQQPVVKATAGPVSSSTVMVPASPQPIISTPEPTPIANCNSAVVAAPAPKKKMAPKKKQPVKKVEKKIKTEKENTPAPIKNSEKKSTHVVAPQPQPAVQKKAATPVIAKAAVPSAVPSPLHPQTATPAASTVSNEASEQGLVLYIGRDDMQEHALHGAVYEAVRQVWRPPPGFAGGVSVQVAIDVDWQGAVANYSVLKSSGVPLFDACVRRDSKRIVFPRAAWGKKWILTFSNDSKA